MNCLQCRNWQLKDSPLRAYGFGQCAAITDPMRHAGQTFAGNTPCRIGKFQLATAEVIARRAKEGSGIL